LQVRGDAPVSLSGGRIHRGGTGRLVKRDLNRSHSPKTEKASATIFSGEWGRAHSPNQGVAGDRISDLSITGKKPPGIPPESLSTSSSFTNRQGGFEDCKGAQHGRQMGCVHSFSFLAYPGNKRLKILFLWPRQAKGREGSLFGAPARGKGKRKYRDLNRTTNHPAKKKTCPFRALLT